MRCIYKGVKMNEKEIKKLIEMIRKMDIEVSLEGDLWRKTIEENPLLSV